MERSTIALRDNIIGFCENHATSPAADLLLGGRPALSAVRKASVILAKSGQQRAAIQVDSIVGNREIVVKTIGPQLARLAGVAGATMLGSGQIVLIMNPVQLVFRDSTQVALDAPAQRLQRVRRQPHLKPRPNRNVK